MKHLITIVFFGFCSLAVGEIYKYVDPATGALEHSNQPKRGAIRMNSGDTLSEIPGSAQSGYKCPGELEQQWQVKPLPTVGCYRIDDKMSITTDDELREELARVKRESNAREGVAAKGVALRKQRALAAAEINKKWPGARVQHEAGGWTCFPRVGMTVDTHENILGLRKLGYTENSAGKFERWGGNCRVTSRGKLITAVAC